MRSAICFLHETDTRHAVGGKARGLAKLIATGFPVPGGFVVMPEAGDDEIIAAYRCLGAGPVAVRSSAEEEDSETRSYAGQFDTFLDISGEEHVVDAVKACRASASSPRVVSYRQDVLAQLPHFSERDAVFSSTYGVLSSLSSEVCQVFTGFMTSTGMRSVA